MNQENAQQRQVVESAASDMRRLSAEAKSLRLNDIRHSADDAAVLLKKIITSNTSFHLLCTDVPTITDLLRPLMLSLASKQPKVVNIALSCVQKMISNGLMYAEEAQRMAFFRRLIDHLNTLQQEQIEEVKIIQTLLALLTAPSSRLSGNLLSTAFAVCIHLKNRQDPIVANTASATLRQIISVIFERLPMDKPITLTGSDIAVIRASTDSGRDTPQAGTSVEDSLLIDAYCLVYDLLAATQNTKALWIADLVQMQLPLAVELLETCVSSNPPAFCLHTALKELMTKNLVHLCTTNLSKSKKGQLNFADGVRILRLSSRLLKIMILKCDADDVEPLLGAVIAAMDEDRPFWLRIGATEACRELVTNAEILLSTCRMFDEQQDREKLCSVMVQAVSQTLKVVVHKGQKAGSSFSLEAQHQGMNSHHGKMYVLDCLEKELIDVPLQAAAAVCMSFILGLSTTVCNHILGGRSQETVLQKNVNKDDESSSNVDETATTLVKSVWTGVLNGLDSIVASTDDEALLQPALAAYQNFTYVSGVLGLDDSRDALILSLIHNAMPQSAVQLSKCFTMKDGGEPPPAYGSDLIPPDEILNRMRLRNVQSFRTLVNIAYCLGNILDSTWFRILDTIQCLHDILSCYYRKRTSASVGGADVNSSPSAANRGTLGREDSGKMAVFQGLGLESAQISMLLDRLFESSHYLDKEALQKLCSSLCEVSGRRIRAGEAHAQAGRAAMLKIVPFTFALEKLQDVLLSNLDRSEAVWSMIAPHLLKASSSPLFIVRDGAARVLTSLISTVVTATDAEEPESGNGEMLSKRKVAPKSAEQQNMYIVPLQELGQSPYAVAHKYQLQCMLRILETTDPSRLGHVWPSVIDVIDSSARNSGAGLGNSSPGSGLIRDSGNEESQITPDVLLKSGFQCASLVVTDFLSSLSLENLRLVVDSVGCFGSQHLDLNISLTAIGMLWSITDSLVQSQAPEGQGVEKLTLDDIWLTLYGVLSDLCVDDRPEIRRSASQTLFNGLRVHGSALSTSDAKNRLIEELIRLLAKVDDASQAAFKATGAKDEVIVEEVQRGGARHNILMHHSRNTIPKQWMEIRLLVLSGICEYIQTYIRTIIELPHFLQLWKQSLSYIVTSMDESSKEVYTNSTAALELICKSTVDVIETTRQSHDELVANAWEALHACITQTEGQSILPQAAHVALLNSLSHIFNAMRLADPPRQRLLDSMPHIMHGLILLITIPPEEPYFDVERIHPIHAAARDLLQSVCGSRRIVEADKDGQKVQKVEVDGYGARPEVLRSLGLILAFSTEPPVHLPSVDGPSAEHTKERSTTARSHRPTAGGKLPQFHFLALACCPLIKSALELVSLNTLRNESEDQHGETMPLFRELFNAIVQIAAKRWHSISPALGMAAAEVLLSLTQKLLTGIEQHPDETEANHGLWLELLDMLRNFLFAPEPMSSVTTEDVADFETIDVQFVELFCASLIKSFESISTEITANAVDIFQSGSNVSHRNYTTEHASGPEDLHMRERFAGACFDALMALSTIDSESKSSRVAAKGVINRCSEVLSQYILESGMHGNVPLPRARLTEVREVLRTIDGYIQVLLQSPAGTISHAQVKTIYDLYPAVVNCTTCSDAVTQDLLKRLLLKFGRLTVSLLDEVARGESQTQVPQNGA
eukprot:Clim_evm80s11 gene=Clim_evmTU80s11